MVSQSRRLHYRSNYGNKKLSEVRKNMIHNLLAPSFESNNASPHCVIELSTRLYKRMKDNTIMVHGMHMTHENLIAYDRTEYGCNITHRQCKKVN